MTTSTLYAPSTLRVCRHCSSTIENGAKFCGECGCLMERASTHQAADTRHQRHRRQAAEPQHVAGMQQPVSPPAVPSQVSYDELAQLEAYRLAQTAGNEMDWRPTPSPVAGSAGEMARQQRGTTDSFSPNFAQVGRRKQRQVSPELVRELETLNAALIREQFFLIVHWSIFLVTNLIGFFIAMQCYTGMVGDEMTKIVMALTPLTFINAVALACLAPIKGTRAEIARIKERVQYVRFQMEYANVI